MTVKLFIAASLDGYIATSDDDLHWLFDCAGVGDNGYSAFYRTIDTVVMGRRTYDWIRREQPGEWPYAGKACYVLTRQQPELAAEVDFIGERALIGLMAEAGLSSRQIWVVGGGEVIRLFLAHHWIDELRVTVAPVLLGSGRPLFPAGDYSERLRLLGTQLYGQFVELRYAVER